MSTPLTGATGEYYVAAMLSHTGWVASITPRNADRTDILAQHVEDGTVVAIQVKTSSGAPQFRMSHKDEETVSGTAEWYVAVRLTAFDEPPVFYVVPRNVVSALLYLDHRHFLAQPGKDGMPHKDTPQRLLRTVDIEVWRESWTALTLEPYARPSQHRLVVADLPQRAERRDQNARVPLALAERVAERIAVPSACARAFLGRLSARLRAYHGAGRSTVGYAAGVSHRRPSAGGSVTALSAPVAPTRNSTCSLRWLLAVVKPSSSAGFAL